MKRFLRTRRRFAAPSPLALSAVLALSAIAAYTILVVIIAATSAQAHARVFWPTIVVMVVLSLWLGRRAWRVWQKSADASRKRGDHE
jgi:FtsH-binding integral membrane protein